MVAISLQPTPSVSIMLIAKGSRLKHLQRVHRPVPGLQIAGLLKERSQDYYVAATDIAFEGGYFCSQTSWTDCDEDSHAAKVFGDCTGNGCGSAAGCSTTNSGTGVVSSTAAPDAPSIVVTGVFDGHGYVTTSNRFLLAPDPPPPPRHLHGWLSPPRSIRLDIPPDSCRRIHASPDLLCLPNSHNTSTQDTFSSCI